MSINILMPALSPTMTEGKLAKWHVKEGDTVKSGQVICEIETDKATMEVEAVDEGKIGQIVVAEGTEGVKVNAVIAVLLEEGETEVPKDAAAPAAAPAGRKACSRCSACRRTGAGRAQGRACRRASAAARSGAGRRAHLRVAARQAHRGGQGPRSRAHQGQRPERPHRQGRRRGRQAGRARCGASGRAGAARSAAGRRAAGVRGAGRHSACRTPSMRKVIARRMLESKQTVPHFYLTVDLEIDALLAARQAINAVAREEGRQGLGQRHGDQGLRQGAARSSRVQCLVDRGRDDPVRRGRHLGRRRHRPRPDHADRAQRRHEGRWRRSRPR